MPRIPSKRSGLGAIALSSLLFMLSLLLVVPCGCRHVSNRDGDGASARAIEERVDAITAAVLPAVVVDGDPVETVALADLMRAGNVPGLGVAVLRDGRIEWARGMGDVEADSDRPVTADTLFQAASISKPVTAAAALSMVQDGLLDLDEDVNVRLKGWKVPANEHTAEQPVTLRMLLSHTAGMTVHGFPGYPHDAPMPGTVDVLDGKGNTPAVRVDQLPGSQWRYSGGGYTVVQKLMVDVARKPFAEIMRERVLEPAGMAHSTFEQPLAPVLATAAATAHDRDGAPVKGRFHRYPEQAAAGLWTTPSDLLRFALAIQRSRAGEPGGLLTPALAREMLTPGMRNWGLGPVIQGDGKLFGHGGGNMGFRCSLTASLDGGWGIAVMTNSDRGALVARQLMSTVAASYGWQGLEPPRRTVVDIGAEALAQLAGRYEIAGMGELEFEAVGDRLFADVEGQGRLEFLPQSETVVVQRDDGRVITFVRDGGRVTGFESPGIVGKRLD